MAKQTSTVPTADIEAMTLQRIIEMKSEFNSRRNALIGELANLQRSRAGRAAVAVAPPPDVIAARERAKQLLNGQSTRDWSRLNAVSRETEVEIEISAIDLCLITLDEDEIRARAVALGQWLESNGRRWRGLARSIIITAIQLRSLENAARAMRDEARHFTGSLPSGLAMSDVIGVKGRSVMTDDFFQPFDRVTQEAVQQGLVDRRDVQNAQRVRVEP